MDSPHYGRLWFDFWMRSSSAILAKGVCILRTVNCVPDVFGRPVCIPVCGDESSAKCQNVIFGDINVVGLFWKAVFLLGLGWVGLEE